MQCGSLTNFLQDTDGKENIDKILEGKDKFNNKELVACFEKLQGLKDAGAFPENMATIEYFDAKQLFDEGSAAMFGTGQWDCAEFDEISVIRLVSGGDQNSQIQSLNRMWQ